MLFDGQLQNAVRDYEWLLDRGYPDRGSLKLVGDRYRLNSDERNLLYRGVSALPAARLRSSRRIPGKRLSRRGLSRSHAGSRLWIDGYNVLFTVLNYLLGRPVFISRDGFVRDIGGVRGRVLQEDRLFDAAESLLRVLSGATPASMPVILLIDEPVDRSREHARRIRVLAATALPAFECRVENGVDSNLIGIGAPDLIATSDSRIIDDASAGVIDLARETLSREFGFSPPTVGTRR